MAQKLVAPMPPDLELFGSYTVELTAVDPSSGAFVAGVTISQLVIAIESTNAAPITNLAVGEFQLVPGPGA